MSRDGGAVFFAAVSKAVDLGEPMAAALRLLLSAALALLVVATAACLAGGTWWGFELFTHFRLQWLGLAALVLLAAALRRAWRPALLAMLLALPHALAVTPPGIAGAAAQAEAAPPAPRLRLIAANLRWSNPRPAAAADWLLAQQADLLLLQESLPLGSHRRAEILARYPFALPLDRRRQDGLLLSRHPILWHRIDYPAGSPLPLLHARIAVHDREIEVIALHAPPPVGPRGSRLRNAYLREVAARARGAEAVIVAGDFNSTPWSPHFRALLRDADLVSSARLHPLLGTWPRQAAILRIPIDQVLVGGAARLRALARGPDIGSDHFPIIAEVELQP